MRDPKEERRDDFQYWLDIPSRWQDCDAYGHVNNVVYYSWFDTAVTTLLIARRVIWMHDSPVIGLCVESGCRFLSPVGFPETIDAGVRVGRLGTSSVRYEVGLFRQGVATPAAVGHFVHVYVDRATRRPTALDAGQKAALADLEASAAPAP